MPPKKATRSAGKSTFQNDTSFDRKLIVCKVVKIGDGKGSFLNGESVVSDGDVVLFVPLNPLFLALPHLRRKTQTEALTIDKILDDEEYPKLQNLANNKTLLIALKKVCDVEITRENFIFKLNSDKLLNWLKKKWEISKGFHTSEEESMKIMKEYLQDDLFKELRVSFGLVQETVDIEDAEPTGSLKRKTAVGGKKGTKRTRK
ncbi:hypothetical protein QR680_009925 [Steinernema hermaphroditum]|uniref:Ribonuclease H2 subunit B wHTH domain-containing protein n=1 Tax=Steinernema hermaphroditum TaxID=289476 RepID=A0AA39IPM4_9BILA|nr:hypothetical protein QR680_009925 [Steinernema hermaphroditum]